MAGVTPLWQICRDNLRIRNEYVKEGIAEFIGTGILCMFAVGAASQAMIDTFASGAPVDSIQPVLGGVFGLMTAILVTGGISGAHINPAVSVGLAIVGEVSWFKVPVYWICQIFGGYVGSGLAVAMYKSKADFIVETVRAEKNDPNIPYFDIVKPIIFSPVPAIPTTVGTGIADQIMCTTILMMGVLACIDKRNMKVPKHLLAFFICLIVAGISMCFGANAGAVMNPARDLSPRLMGLTIGIDFKDMMKCPNKSDTTERSEHWWLVGIFGPLIGASFGALMYMLLLGAHMNDEEETNQGRGSEDIGGNPADWRSTRFIPKAQAPLPPPQQGQQTDPRNGSMYGPGQGQYGGNGVNNNGYRDDMRYRQGY